MCVSLITIKKISVDMNLCKLLNMARDKKARRAAVRGVAKSQTQLSD